MIIIANIYEKNNNTVSENKEFGVYSTGSDYLEYEEVVLCDSCAGKEMLGCYNDGMALINLNSMEIVEFDKREGLAVSIKTWEQSKVFLYSSGAREIWELNITLNESLINAENIKNFYCSKCSEALLANNQYELALIDFSSNTVYPIKSYNNTKYLDEYYMKTQWKNSGRLSVLVVHSPS